MAESAKWYVVHTYSGYENAVAATIMKSAETRRLLNQIIEVNIPMETVTEQHGSESKTVERKIFPGYVLIKMMLTDESWHLVRNTRGVTGFVGSSTGPVPLTEDEIVAMGVEKNEVIVGFNEGDTIKVCRGPLEGFLGTVEEIDSDRNLVKVVVSMFGRETPVDLELDQVESVDN